MGHRKLADLELDVAVAALDDELLPDLVDDRAVAYRLPGHRLRAAAGRRRAARRSAGPSAARRPGSRAGSAGLRRRAGRRSPATASWRTRRPPAAARADRARRCTRRTPARRWSPAASRPLGDPPFQVVVEVLDGPLGRLALADVADGRGDDDAVLGVQRAQADLGREEVAVGPARLDLDSGGVRPVRPPRNRRSSAASACGPTCEMAGGGTSRLDELAEQVVPPVPEDLLGLGIDDDDAPGDIDAKDRVRGDLEQPAELDLAALPVGDVLDDLDKPADRAVVVPYHGERAVRPEAGAVLTDPEAVDLAGAAWIASAKTPPADRRPPPRDEERRVLVAQDLLGAYPLSRSALSTSY